MVRKSNDDKLEGYIGRFSSQLDNRINASARVPSISAMSKRARTAHFSRPRGKKSVSLKAPPRPDQQRRVMVKVHYFAGGAGTGSASALARHVRYVERDGAGPDAEDGRFFDRELDEADALAFAKRAADDKRHFRLIISPEEGNDLPSLKAYARDLMARAEQDLGTRLDWIAADHHDTGKPHLHVIVRGVRDDGRDLIMPREFVQHGLRGRAEELATELLGPRLERDRVQSLERKHLTQAERFTSLDEKIMALSDGGTLDQKNLSGLPSSEAALIRQRLTRLEHMGLADRSREGWRVTAGWDQSLKSLGQSRQEARALAKILATQSRAPEPERSVSFERAAEGTRLTGVLVGMTPLGQKPEAEQLLAVEGLDGKLWTARLARLDDARALDGVAPGAIVSLDRERRALLPSDHMIADVASRAGGLWSPTWHNQIRPEDRAPYIEALERRLEALRRANVVERLPDGDWVIPGNFTARVEAHLERCGPRNVVSLEDPNGLERQVAHNGPAWLDRADLSSTALAGAGEHAQSALAQRNDWLLSQGHLTEEPNGDRVWVEGADKRLIELERGALAKALERERGMPAYFADDGPVAGHMIGKIQAGERTHALLQHEGALTLAPWRPELDSARSHFVFGQIKGGTISFKFGANAERAYAKQAPDVMRKMSKGIDLDIGGR